MGGRQDIPACILPSGKEGPAWDRGVSLILVLAVACLGGRLTSRAQLRKLPGGEGRFLSRAWQRQPDGGYPIRLPRACRVLHASRSQELEVAV